MGYEVIHTATETIISDGELRIKINPEKPTPGTAFATGTLYQDKGSFTPVQVYHFQALNENISAADLKRLATFFFAGLLDTDHYIVEISRDSSLFPEEAQRIFGTPNYERAI